MTQQQQQKYTFHFTLQECEVIFAGLGEIPTKLGKPLMDYMQQQYTQQVQQQQAEVKPEVTPEME